MSCLSFREPVNPWTHGIWLLLSLPVTLLLWRLCRGNRLKQVGASERHRTRTDSGHARHAAAVYRAGAQPVSGRGADHDVGPGVRAGDPVAELRTVLPKRRRWRVVGPVEMRVDERAAQCRQPRGLHGLVGM